jgi:Tol biopolymer transport system component
VRSGNSAGGDLFFVRDGTLMAQPFDTKAMRLAGEPQPVVDQIGTGRAHAHFWVTPGGVMAFRTGPGNKLQLSWLNRKGEIQERVGDPGDVRGFSLSPDQTRVATFRTNDLWLLDVKRNIQTPLTVDHGVISYAWPVWSADGTQVAYPTGTAMYEKDSNGASDPKLLRELGHLGLPTDWSRDGKFLLYDDQTGAGGSDIFALPLQGGGEPKSILTTPADEGRARLSPDGRWIAYMSDKSGGYEVYLQPFDAPGSGAARPGGVTQISRDGGAYPRWSSDGKELFFRSYPSYAVMAVKIEFSGDTPQPSPPVQLFQSASRSTSWDVSKDGQRFLLAEPLDQGVATPITVVMNWEASLKK